MERSTRDTFGALCIVLAALALASCDSVLKEIEKDAKEVRLTLSSDGHGTVFASAANPLHIGEKVSITAVPNDGWTFSAWECMSGTASIADSHDTTTDITMSRDCTLKATFVGETFTLVVNHDGNCGSVKLNGIADATSVSQVVAWGEYATLEAIPLANYSFVEWAFTGTGVQFRNDNRYVNPVEVRLIEENATVTAVAALVTYALNVAPANASQGATVPSGVVNAPYNQWMAVQATPNGASGYEFDHWAASGAGTVEFQSGSTVASQNVRVTGGAASLTAHFRLKTYTLTVGTSGSGTVNPTSATVTHAVPQSISAVPSAGWHFDQWRKSGGTGAVSFANATAAATTVAVTDGSASIEAVFVLNTYALTANVSGPGTVAPTTATVTEGTPFAINAYPSTGASFTGWTKIGGTGTVSFANSGAAATNVTVTGGPATIQAAFAWNTYTLTLTAGTGGTVSPASATVTYNVPYNITATPGAAYNFSQWQKTAGTGTVTFGNASAPSTTATVTGGSVTIQATFTVKTYALTVNVSGPGTVAPTSATVSDSVPYAINAYPSTGAYFTGWSKTGGAGTVSFAASGSASTTVTVTGGPATIQAAFAWNTYTLTLTAGTGGTVSPASATVTYNVPYSITATPNTGYNFVQWQKTSGTGSVTFGNAAVASTTATVTGGAVTIQASFTLKTYTVTMKREVLAGSGDTSPSLGAHTYTHGTVLTIEAFPVTDQAFEKWTASGTTLAEPYARKTTCTITANATITAYFEPLLAPSNLKVTAITFTTLRILSWTDRSGDEEGFEVWLSYDGLGDLFFPIEILAANVTSWTWNEANTEPHSGAIARFKVAAYRTYPPGTVKQYSVSPELRTTIP
jgi:hypothetical protein